MPPLLPDLIRSQWDLTRGWLGRPTVLERFGEPSVLAGWSVRDLAVHLGRSFGTLAAVSPAPGAVPLTLLAYVSAYAPAAEDIAEGTRDLARTLGESPLAGIDELAARGLAALERIAAAPVVLGPRGPIRRDDFLATRLLELVVHSDDLSRSVPEIEPIGLLDPGAEVLLAALRDAYREASGRDPMIGDRLAWIREAAGRTASADEHLPLF